MREPRILVIPDLHAPFHCEKGLNEIIYFSKHNNPTHVIQIGDALDLFAFSRFSKSLNVSDMTAKQEVESGRGVLSSMWKQLRKHNPKSHMFQMRGNHSHRIDKRVEESLPELVGIVDFKHLWKFDGVNTIYDTKDELIINNIVFMHGYKSRIGDHLRFNHMSTVHGHCHKAGVFYLPIKNVTLWEMDCGHCIDVNSVAAGYLPQRLNNWTKSFGWVDKWGPRVICLG